MKIRTSITAAACAAVLAGGGALLIPAAASATSATHTLKFTALQQKQVMYTKTTGAAADNDVNSAGKLIGFDMVSSSFNTATNMLTIGATVDTNGGFLYGTLTGSGSGTTLKGKVTGGTGKFAGATGTITAKNLNKAGTKTAVTITYTT